MGELVKNPILSVEMILSEATSWINTPIHHQERQKGIGVDCIGFISGVFQKLGCQIKDLTDYNKVPKGDLLLSKLAEHLQEVSMDDIRTGDILVFSNNKGEAQHVAFKTEKGMLHAYYIAGRVVEHTLNRKWQSRLFKVYRYPWLS